MISFHQCFANLFAKKQCVETATPTLIRRLGSCVALIRLSFLWWWSMVVFIDRCFLSCSCTGLLMASMSLYSRLFISSLRLFSWDCSASNSSSMLCCTCFSFCCRTEHLSKNKLSLFFSSLSSKTGCTKVLILVVFLFVMDFHVFLIVCVFFEMGGGGTYSYWEGCTGKERDRGHERCV